MFKATDELESRGPIVQVRICLHQVHEEILIERGNELPEPYIGMALIDTGADQSCIDHTVVDNLGLLPIDVTPVITPNGIHLDCHVYPIRLEFDQRGFDVNEAISLPIRDMHSGNMIALIGRDILKHCFFAYDGPTGDWRLEFGLS